VQVTGNLVEIGWMKMEGLGIRHLFTRPNFGGLVLLFQLPWIIFP
jgi:hypothetical protein